MDCPRWSHLLTVRGLVCRWLGAFRGGGGGGGCLLRSDRLKQFHDLEYIDVTTLLEDDAM
jgi:hypothetical protein